MTKKINTYTILGLFSLMLIGGLYFFWHKNTPVKYIAYVGRFTNHKDSIPISKQTQSDFHLFTVAILQERINEVNKKNTAFRYELLPFDCQQNPEKSKEIYSKIAQNQDIVCTIDNTWGVDIEGAKEIIKKNNLPVIAINADRSGFDFGNAAVFTDNNDLLPVDLVAFSKKILKKDTITFITEKSYKLHHVFLQEFEKEGIIINKKFEISDIEKFDIQDSIRFFAQLDSHYLAQPKDNNLIIINTHYQLGNVILQHFSENYSNKLLLGHTYITSLKDNLRFGTKNNNELILMTDPQDAVSKEVHIFERNFLIKYPQFSDRKNLDFYIRRCFNAISILQHSYQHAKDAKQVQKDSTSHFFNGLKQKKISYDAEIFDFNNKLEVQKEKNFSSFKNGESFSFHQQLNLKKEPIPDMLFGVDIQDIFEIDLNSNSFTADFYYWVKYDTIIKNAEKMILFQNMKQSESSLELIQEKQKDGVMYKIFKVSGKFFVDYDESHYPFDAQELDIAVQIMAPSEKLRVSFDKESFIQDREKIENFTISSWIKQKYYVTVDNHISSNIRGDIENEQGMLNKFKVISFRLDIERRKWSGLVQIVLPLSFIGLIALALLYVKNMSFENLGEASVGTFFSIIAFSISLSDISPSSDLITKSDKLFLLTFVTVFLSFLTIIILNSLFEESDIIGKKNNVVNRFRMLLTVVYPLLFIWIIIS